MIPRNIIMGSGDTQIVPSRSIDYEKSSSQYLSMTAANFGTINNKKFAISLHIKPESLNTNDTIFDFVQVGSEAIKLRLTGATGAFEILTGFSSGDADKITATGVLNAGTYTHIYIVVDTAQSVASNRFKLLVDGVTPSFITDQFPSQNATLDAYTSVYLGAGDDAGSPANYYDGLIYQMAIFSNTIPDITDIINTATLAPKDVRELAGLHSLLQTNGVDSLEDDYVLAADWTNNNTVTKSADIP